MLGAYQKLATTLEKGKTAKPPRWPISGYEGHYWSAAKNYCISMAARPKGLEGTDLLDEELAVIHIHTKWLRPLLPRPPPKMSLVGALIGLHVDTAGHNVVCSYNYSSQLSLKTLASWTGKPIMGSIFLYFQLTNNSARIRCCRKCQLRASFEGYSGVCRISGCRHNKYDTASYRHQDNTHQGLVRVGTVSVVGN